MRPLYLFMLMDAVLAAGFGRTDVAITVLPGAGDYVRPDAQAPVLVILENNDEDRTGRVSVTFTGQVSGPGLCEAHRAVSLPPESKKSLFLYLPVAADPPTEVRVRYETTRGRTVAEVRQPLKPLNAYVPVICGMDNLPPGLPPDTSPDAEPRYERLFLKPEHLPDEARGLEMFDVIIMAPPPYLPLNTERVTALYEWILGGGTLIVDASERTDAFRRGPLRDLLPFVPEGIDEGHVDLFGVATPYARGTIQRGEVLLESNGHPLLIRANCGLGSVACFAVSPSSPAFTIWDGGPATWARLLAGIPVIRKESAVDFASFTAGADRKRQLIDLVQEPQQIGLRISVVLLLTALYALAVGPGDYAFVKWLGRPKATWITFPVLVAAFTIAAYAAARAWVGGEMAAASAQRVLVFPDQHVALRYDLVSLFAPGGQDYRLRHADGAALFNIRPMLADDRRIQIDMDDRTLTQFIPIWQRRVYGASMVTADYPDVDLQLARTGDELVATVHNRSKLVLLDNTVYYGDKCWRIAPEGIQPDGTVSVRLDAATGAPPAAGHPWTHLDNDVNDSWAHGRQFDMRDALRRGAVLFSSGNAGRAACPLLVAGAPQDETGPRVIQVLAYDEGSGS